MIDIYNINQARIDQFFKDDIFKNSPETPTQSIQIAGIEDNDTTEWIKVKTAYWIFKGSFSLSNPTEVGLYELAAYFGFLKENMQLVEGTEVEEVGALGFYYDTNFKYKIDEASIKKVFQNVFLP